MKYSRETLINICKDAVVHHTKWNNRDSYIAQVMLCSIYKGLTAGLNFEIRDDSDDKTIYIEFIQPIDFQTLLWRDTLAINSREEYFNDCDPNYETEMFDGIGIDFYSSYTCGYMPTRERLEEVGIGNDWY